MTKREIVDEVKARLGIRLDRELAALIGVSASRLSEWIRDERVEPTTPHRILGLLVSQPPM